MKKSLARCVYYTAGKEIDLDFVRPHVAPVRTVDHSVNKEAPDFPLREGNVWSRVVVAFTYSTGTVP